MQFRRTAGVSSDKVYHHGVMGRSAQPMLRAKMISAVAVTAIAAAPIAGSFGVGASAAASRKPAPMQDPPDPQGPDPDPPDEVPSSSTGGIPKPLPPFMSSPVDSSAQPPPLRCRSAERATAPSSSASPGYLTVLCSPFCDAVVLGSAVLGPSPVVKAPAPPGEYPLILKRDGERTKTMCVTIESNRTTSIRIQMD